MMIKAISCYKGQNTLEYAIILSLVSLALLSAQHYIRRGIQAGIKTAAAELGGQDAEETDPQKGVKNESTIDTHSSNTTVVQLLATGDTTFTSSNTSASTGETVYISNK